MHNNEDLSPEDVVLGIVVLFVMIIVGWEAYGPPDRPNPSSRETQEVVD